MSKFITVLTPTYNRVERLKKLYNSLKEQTNHNFKWLIVDDGSNDETKNWIDTSNFDGMSVKYLYKENGGKHTAINLGVKNIDTEYTFIVDSDDWLIPNAIEIIWNYINKYKGIDNICGFSFLKGKTEENYVGKKFKKEEFISNHIDCRYNDESYGDKAEVFLTKVLIEFPFPEIVGEKFAPENLIWLRISRKYNTVYVNKIIYICQYLENGITSKGKKILIKSPKSMILLYNENLDKAFKLKYRIKHTIQYTIYSLFNKTEIFNIIKGSNAKVRTILLFPVSFSIYLYWKFLYR